MENNETKIVDESNSLQDTTPAENAVTGEAIITSEIIDDQQITESTDEAVNESAEVVAETETLVETLVETETTQEPIIDETVEVEAEQETAVVENMSEVETATEIQPEIIAEQVDETDTTATQMAELEKEHAELDTIAKDLSHHDGDDDEEIHDVEDHTDYSKLTMEELVVMMEDLMRYENVVIIKTKMANCSTAFQELLKGDKIAHHNTFIEEGGEEENYRYDNEYETRFREVLKNYKSKKYEYQQAKELQKVDNLKHKQELLEELRKLIDSDAPLKDINEEFKALQEKWRDTGMVPQAEMNNLWMNYNFLVDKFFDKIKIDRELRDIGLRKNLELKIELTEKAEELLIEKSITKSFKLLQEYHRKWKEIGPVPADKKEEIWERFKNVSDKVNERRKEHYDFLANEQKTNLGLKAALVEKAELISTDGLTTTKEWADKGNEINELFAEWRKVGPAPKKDNDEIWNKFKGLIDEFYEAKKEFFKHIKDGQMQNFNIKQDICKQAEAIMESTDWKNTTKELINLQQQWKKVGPVPKKLSDKVWKRFRTACDHFFNAKDEYFKNIDSVESSNLEAKKTLINHLNELVLPESKEEALNLIKTLQTDWLKLGRVPIKFKDSIQKEFREAVDKKMSDAGISNFDMDMMNIKDRYENSDDAKRSILREKNALVTSIQKIQSEITLLENNMGFLASSKNADLLKGEIERKIKAARQKIEGMDAKLRILDKTQRALNTKE